MKIFLLLFILFVPKAHSRIQPSKFYIQAEDSIKTAISTAFCTIGRQIASEAAEIKKICSELHDLGTKLPKTVPLQGITDGLGKQLTKENPLNDLTDKETAKSLDYVCNKPSKYLGHLSKIFTKFCQNGSQMTPAELTTLSTAISALPTLSTSIPALTTLSTSTLAPTTQSTSTLAPTTQSTSTLAPTTSTLAPTTPKTSTPAPSTSTLAPSTSTLAPSPSTLASSTSTLVPSTSTPAPTTTQSICDQSTNDRCVDTCKRKSGYQLNLGGKCVVIGKGTRMCRCKKVKHCESYKNATCEKKCEEYNNSDICQIPEAGYSCVCRFTSAGETIYRLPK